MSIFQLDSIPYHDMEKAKRKSQRDFTINQKIGWKALLVSEEVSAENIIVQKTDAEEHLEGVYPTPSHYSSLKRFHCNGISVFSVILFSLKRFSFIWESRALNMWILSIKPHFSGLLAHTLTQWAISPVFVSKEPLQNKFRYLISNIAHLVLMRRGGVLQKNVCGRRACSQDEGRGRIIRLLLESKQ